jgi:hypothetical protein
MMKRLTFGLHREWHRPRMLWRALDRCAKMNCLNSDAESWTGISVVVDFPDVAGMMSWTHLKIDELVLGGLYLQML